MVMKSLVQEVRSLGTVFDETIDERYESAIYPPSDWDKASIERRMDVTIPPDLEDLWNECSDMILYQGRVLGLLGLVIWSPEEVEKYCPPIIATRQYDYRNGDMIIGMVSDSGELIVIRCDKAAKDFGEVIVAQPIDGRETWPIAGASLEILLRRFLDSRDKYWRR